MGKGMAVLDVRRRILRVPVHAFLLGLEGQDPDAGRV